jgi:hypothetical protein
VWAALARRELRFTLRHPLLVAGLVASGWVLFSMNRDQVPHLGGFSTYVGLGLAPLAGVVLLVGHLAASRAQRHQTVEIESTAPAIERARTLGRLVGTIGSAASVAISLVAVYMVYLFLRGGTGSPDLAELLVGPVVVGLAAAAGVAAGTWFPNRFSGLLALGVLAGDQIALQDAAGANHWYAWWHTVLWYDGFDLWIRPGWGHVAYLTGAAAVTAAVAALRDGSPAPPIAVAVLGMVLLVAGGAVQSQPPTDAEVDGVWDRVAAPEAHWLTIEHAGTTYHVQPSYQRWIDWWDEAIAATVAPISPPDRPALVVEQRPHAFPSQLLDEFRGESDPAWLELMERANDLYFGSWLADPWPIQVGESLSPRAGSPLAIPVAIRAVGLPLIPVELEGPLYTEEEIASFNYVPTDPTRGLPRPVLGDHWTYEVACNAEGQAREVVAAWLAAQASPELAGRYHGIRQRGLASPNDYGPGGFTEYGIDEPAVPAVQWDWIGWIQYASLGGGSVPASVLGSPTATDLAAQLLARPYDEVATAVRQHWDAWTDPATSVQTIVDAFDLERPPTPEQWIERSGANPADYEASIAAYPLWLGENLLGDRPYPTCR